MLITESKNYYNESMKKYFLAGINSKYNHVSLSTRALEAYVQNYSAEYGKRYFLTRKDFTINQPVLDVLKDFMYEEYDCIMFSVYIWNVEFVKKLIVEIKKLQPETLIGLGGPEVSFCAEKFLSENPATDFIICGEGEETFREVCETLAQSPALLQEENNFPKENNWLPKQKLNLLNKIPGLCLKTNASSAADTSFANTAAAAIIYTPQRPLIKNLDTLPFVYSTKENKLRSDIDPKNSILYYETSRGCPFRCSYCLSSTDISVRFKSLEKVKDELNFFLKNKVRLVKFVDRTYNLNEERYIAIWQYIIENWNGITTFHFEIEAQQLTNKALECIKNVKPNCMQFEIGIQTTNEPTLKEIQRQFDSQKIKYVLENIPESIHVHLDLIAGLPYETLFEFENSFNYTIKLNPRMLQLGFLKILHGTQMESFAEKNPGYKWLSCAPYEVLCSPWMTCSELQMLKHIDLLVDNIYNSQNFLQTLKYIYTLNINQFAFYTQLESYLTEKKFFDSLHKPEIFFDILFDFFSEYNEFIQKMNIESDKVLFCGDNILIIKEILKFDYIRRAKTSTFPSWYKHNYSKENHRAVLENNYDISSTRDSYINSAYEEFSVNPFTFEVSPAKVLFIYNTQKLNGAAAKTFLKEENTECILIEDSMLSLQNRIGKEEK